MPTNWTKEQLQAITEKGSNILVAAAAGSGKTTVLVERIMRKIIDDNINIEKKLIPIIKENTSSYTIKSRNISKDKVDLIVEVRSKNELELVNKCSKLKNIVSVNLLSHDGEIRM